MRLGVLADTHSRPLPPAMLDDFKKVDGIIHAGDFCDLAVLAQLKKIKDVQGVYGNMDEVGIRKIFPRRQILVYGNFSIGLFHGEGPAEAVLDVVKKEFSGETVDAVIFGHSHRALSQQEGPVLYFNPGSPNDTVCAPCCSYGILDLGDQIKARIIKIKS